MTEGVSRAILDLLGRGKLTATGAPLSERYLTFQEYFGKPGTDPARWGSPVSALLGALAAQMDYGVAAIGGKDSMSGSFEKLDVPPTLGSRSTDLLSGLGPAPVRAGDVLPLGTGSQAAEVPPLITPSNDTVTLEVLPGPRTDWLVDPDLAGEWTVSPDSNRVGVRLAGPAVALNRTDQLSSEGVVRGAIQIPPGGLPVIFGPDHPTTGGYPVVGVLTDLSCDALAQLRPGQRVRLRPRENRVRPTFDGGGL